MKQFRQLAALFLAFAMVIGVFSKPTVAFAEETLTSTTLDETQVAIDYENEKLEIPKTSSETIYYTFKYAEKSHANTVWETAFEESDTLATIDFSNVAATKAVKVYLTNDKEKKPKEKEIKAQETTLAVAFSGVANTTSKSRIKVENDWTDLTKKIANFSSTTKEPWAYGYLCITVGKGTAAKAITADEAKFIEFRKGTTGQWKSLAELDVRKYTAYGAQLYFRIRPLKTGDVVVTGGAITALGRPSKEVKVTYTKQANAPKISITGATKEIKLAKTQEYRVYTTSGSSVTYGSWIKVADYHMDGTKIKKVYLEDLKTTTSAAWSYEEGLEGQGVELRIAASDKSVASKVAKVALNQAITPDVSTDSAITFKLVSNTTFDKGIEVSNASGPAIQVAVVSGESINVNDTKVVKWVSVAPGKKTTLSGKVLAVGDRIIVRNAFIKDNAKTAKNEFIVASDYATVLKSKFTLAEQSFAVNNAVINPTVASTSAIATGSGLNYTVTVTNTASPTAITVVADVATANVAAGTPTVKCVAEATASAATADSKGITATASKIENAAGKITFKITAAAGFGDRIFRVTIDGLNAYITVKYVNS